jgi:hypothetical protein
MGKALAEAYPEARATFDEADTAFASSGPPEGGPHPSLSSLCFEGPEDQLTLTEVTQPALLATSIAACRVLAAHGLTPAFVAGHSLGEYSANVAAGTLAFADAVAVVRRRGRYMQEAVPVGQGAMAAVLGADADTVRRACAEAAQGEVRGLKRLLTPRRPAPQPRARSLSLGRVSCQLTFPVTGARSRGQAILGARARVRVDWGVRWRPPVLLCPYQPSPCSQHHSQ